MGTRERYEPGTFSWTDLGTDDPEAAIDEFLGMPALEEEKSDW